MEKHILKYSYWLGVICTLIALVWRAANFFGFFVSTYVPGISINYMSFMKAALLFLILCAATSLYMTSSGAQKC